MNDRIRKLPVGAELVPGGVHFRVWAPRRKTVAVVLESESAPRHAPLAPAAGGHFQALVEGAGEGTRYRFRLDDVDYPYPDPASRFQPEGPHGPSEVVDPARFDWTDEAWRGVALPGQVLYELHVGTFTREGTWASAQEHLPRLKNLGVTAIEVMPVAEFPGRFGWGYDGVALFAPSRLYGRPDDFRRFVNAAHRIGLGVILDVVYNHLGPSGNYLAQFAEEYFTKRYPNEWGDAINFDGERAGPVRELFLANAAYWVREFHVDGLRLDATQSIFDGSREHVVSEVVRAVRAAAGGRATVVIGENESQHAHLVTRFGVDALWNDDLHHAAVVALTGRREAYYTDYHGTPQELVSALKWGFLYQGQRYRWQGHQRRGTPARGIPSAAFVAYLENHDQVANSANGARLHAQTWPRKMRAVTAVLLLGPGTPMLFQGQEFAASAPFLYFADHEPELAQLVQTGRREFLSQFPSIQCKQADGLAAPHDPATFEACKLDHAERERGPHAQAYALHRDLLALRRQKPFAKQDAALLHGAVLGTDAFVLRWLGEDADGAGDRLLVVNLGADLELWESPEPLLAPPLGKRWRVLWHSEAPEYGGCAAPASDGAKGWTLPSASATVLAPGAIPEDDRREPPPGGPAM